MRMIEVKNLVKHYEAGQEILKNLNFIIETGELCCLLGASGSGKSTLLQVLAGLSPLTAGEIMIDGQSVTALPPKDRKIGFVFQDYALYPHMTVLQNVQFPLIVGANKLDKKLAQQKALHYLAVTEIADLANKKPAQLSGGEQQRVAIARALVIEPAILLLDEPLSNLDARLHLKIRKEIRQLVKKVGITTLLVTHDQEDALAIADHVMVLHEHQIQQKAAPKEVYVNPANLYTAKFLGSPVMNSLPIVVGATDFTIGTYHLGKEQLPVSLPAGDYLLGIRAENLALSSMDGELSAVITGIEMLGHEQIIQVAVGELSLAVLVPLAENFTVGSSIAVSLDFAKALLFDKGGARIY
jgi:multiple sugar transport system ATP-binding protein